MKFGTVVAFFLTFLLSQLWGTLASPMIKAVAPQAFSTFAGSPGTSPFALMFDSVPAFWASADVMASWSNGFYQVHVNRKSTPIAVRSILNKGGEQIKLFDEWQFILPGHVFVYGNVRGGNPDDGYTGNLRAMDCDFNRNCWGEERMMTLFELTRESPVRTVTDLSLVNGYNMAMDVEFGKGSDCKPLNCTIPAQKILDLCPSERRSGTDKTPGCMSPCQATGRPQDCCTGEFANSKCSPSGKEFDAFCHAYDWATDDTKSQTCNPGDKMIVYLG